MSGDPDNDYHVMLDRFKVLIEDDATGFFETNPSGELVFFNDSFCNMVGRPPEELIKHHLGAIIDPEEGSAGNCWFDRIKNGNDSPSPIIWRINHADGLDRILAVSPRMIIDAHGRYGGVRGIVRDVTAQMQNQEEIARATSKIEQLYARSHQSKRRYRAFLKFLPIPLLVQNMDHSVAYLNPAYEKTFGWTREDLDLNPFAPIPQDQIKKTLTGKASLLTNGVFYDLETKRLTKDGRELDVIYDGSALYDHNGEPNGLITTMRDITQSKKDARVTQALFNIAKALHYYSDLKTA